MPLSNSLEYLDTQKNYLLAVSGGVDSMMLLYLFQNSNLKFHVTHCNFKLRGENSDLDENLVTNYCEENNIKLHKISFNTLKLKKNRESIEMLARKLRYDFFNKIMKEFSLDFLVTAHHLNDKAETFFINLLRGSGLKGLSNMQKTNDSVLRPLLNYSRKDILNYAVKINIPWREDESNQTTDYLRNKIRHQVIPILENINPSFLKQAEKSMTILHDSEIFINKETQKLKEYAQIENNIFSQEILKNSDFILVYNLFSEFGFTSKTEIIKVLEANTGKVFKNSQYTIYCNRKTLLFKETKESISNADAIIINQIPFQISEPFYFTVDVAETPSPSINTEYINPENIIFPLTLTKWKEGDYFYPINGNGKKKLSKFFKDLKLSLPEKENIKVLYNGNGDIIWVIGFRLDDRFKVTNETKKFIRLQEKN